MFNAFIHALRQRFSNYIHTGVVDSKITEHNRQMIMINLFGLVGQSITLVLGLIALLGQQFILSACLLISSTVFSGGHFIVKIGGKRSIASSFILYNLMALMLYLVYAGGVDNTGPLWLYLVPPVTLFFSGFKRGLGEIMGFIFIVSLMFFVQAGGLLLAEYSHSFKLRLIMSFLTVTFLSAYYEHSRQILFQHTMEMQEKFELQAKQDSLTQLLNRRGMSAMLEHEHFRLERHDDPLAILLCDVDHFKHVNDTFGHADGDAVLIALAEIFKQAVRKQDMVARWGGEEFLFMLPDANLQNAFTIADKIRRKVESVEIPVSGGSVNITLSFGIAELTRKDSIDHTISIADQRLYIAKKQGRNRVVPLLHELKESATLSAVQS